jgi:hypothetical protein
MSVALKGSYVIKKEKENKKRNFLPLDLLNTS